LVRRILSRAHGKLGNVWREGLIEVCRQESGPESGGSLTKRTAQAIIEAAVSETSGKAAVSEAEREASGEAASKADGEARVESGGEVGASGRRVLETRLIDLPRHQLGRVLRAAKASLDTPSPPAPSYSSRIRP
jgi:hypothetical protein